MLAKEVVYDLYIGNKNYSSWSLRPWVIMRQLEIAFKEHLIPFGNELEWQNFRKISPSGKVPYLVKGSIAVWDSLAILEYLAERHPIWPTKASARAWARSAAAEMHSGFTELRNRCSMSCGQRIRLHEMPLALNQEIARLNTLWNDGLHRFSGPYLAGAHFTGVDAFFAPVIFRIQTYGLQLSGAASTYVSVMLNTSAMHEWYQDALREKFRDSPHENSILQMGTVLEDFRARA